MDVLGAVASTVQLAQFAAKGVDFLREIREIQSDYSDLCKEIDFIGDIVHKIQEREEGSEKNSLGQDVQDQVQQTKLVLEEVVSVLNDMKAKSERETSNGDLRARKSKWILHREKIVSSLQKAHRAKVNFNMAVMMEMATLSYKTSVQVEKVHHRLDTSLPGIEQHMSLQQGVLLSIQQQYMVKKVVDDSLTIRELGDTTRVLNHEDTNMVSDGRSDARSLPQRLPFGGQAIQQPGLMSLRACQCHVKPWRISSPQRMNQLIGSWELKYKQQVTKSLWELRCSCDKSGDWTVSWRPLDFWLKRFFPSSRSYSLRCAFRAPRIIPWSTSGEWRYIEMPAEYMREAMKRGMVLYPDDQDETGYNIVERVVNVGAFDILKMLLVEWENILPGQRLPSNAGYEAQSELRFKKMERDAHLLQKVIMYADCEVEMETKDLHEAARFGTSVQNVLDKLQSRATVMINELDEMGYAPLHYAARQDHIQAMQELIEAGADVNRKDFQGWTPLMIAAVNNHIQCMSQLLLAKCRIQDKNRNGRTALHEAAFLGNYEAMRFLLRQEASSSALALDCATPLHLAAECEKFGATRDQVEATIQLLLDAPNTDINAVNLSGYTPLAVAIAGNYPFALHYLAQSGASFIILNNVFSENLLHYTAIHAHLEILLFLQSQNLSNINWQLRNQFGNTPWDEFIFTINAHPWEVNNGRKPCQAEMIAFVQLYKGIRVRELGQDISLLEQALAALSQGDASGACHHLVELINRKKDYKDLERAGFYRGIEREIKSGDRNTPLRTIAEDLDDLRNEMIRSPWDQDSHWDSFNQHSSESESVEPIDVESVEGAESEDDYLSTCMEESEGYSDES